MEEFVFLNQQLITDTNKLNARINMKLRRLFIFGTIVMFTSSLVVFSSSCGGSKKASTPKGPKVKSSSGMGNQKHKNKHVWGK